MCIHHDLPQWCPKCKANKALLEKCAWKKNLWHLRSYGQSVIGRVKSFTQGVQMDLGI